MHVGYLPGQRILGLYKLARIVEHYAARPQVQERLTKQVADWLYASLVPRGAGVMIEAEHTCMTLRGVQAAGSRSVASTLLGTLREDPRSREEFLAPTGISRRGPAVPGRRRITRGVTFRGQSQRQVDAGQRKCRNANRTFLPSS